MCARADPASLVLGIQSRQGSFPPMNDKTTQPDHSFRTRPGRYWIDALIYTSMRSTATEALRSLGASVFPALREAATHDGNNRVREEARAFLDAFGPRADQQTLAEPHSARACEEEQAQLLS